MPARPSVQRGPKLNLNIPAPVEGTPSHSPSSSSDWVNVKILGNGTLSTVWLITNPATHECRAKKQYVNDISVQHKIAHEITFLKRAEHPNIVKLVQEPQATEGRTQCVHLEFMDLGSLDQLMENVNLLRTPQERCDLAKAIAVPCLAGLAFLHLKMNEIHRDIKPGNILCNSEGRVKLCDFDCGFETSCTRAASTYTGTNLYCAPEVEKGESYCHTCDLWSLAVVLFEVATGTLPPSDKQVKSINFGLVKDDLLRELLQSLLVLDPTHRFDALSALYHPALSGFYDSRYTFHGNDHALSLLQNLEDIGFCVDIFRLKDPQSVSAEDLKRLDESFLLSWRDVTSKQGVTIESKRKSTELLKKVLLKKQEPSISYLKKVAPR